MTDRLVTVSDPLGNVIALRVPALSEADRAIVAEAWHSAFPAGLGQQDAAALLIELAETISDEAAYERVCERRGLLPL